MVFSTLIATLAFVQGPPPPATFQVYGRSAAQNERRVSLRVKDSSLQDVLGKLPKVNYAVDADAFKNRRLTLNLSDVPLSRALDAIASALDAHWEERGGVHVLKPGAGFGFNGTLFRTYELPKGQLFDGKTFVKPLPPGEFKDLFKKYEGMKGLTPEQEKEVQKALEDAQKSLKGFQGDELQKALERARAQGQTFRTPMNEELRKALEKARAAHTSNIDALLKSITPAQKELAKRQGYLKISDLTPEQLRMIDHKGDGTFEMTITRDGETLRIKN